jgi:hypothetical protein
MKPVLEAIPRCNWKQSLLWLVLSALCFNASYVFVNTPITGFFILGFVFFLVRLVYQPTVRRAFYLGLVTGLLCYAPQLYFFWTIFNAAAVVLWMILAFWLALFSALAGKCLLRWEPGRAFWLIPVLWTGLEYFRS